MVHTHNLLEKVPEFQRGGLQVRERVMEGSSRPVADARLRTAAALGGIRSKADEILHAGRFALQGQGILARTPFTTFPRTASNSTNSLHPGEGRIRGQHDEAWKSVLERARLNFPSIRYFPVPCCLNYWRDCIRYRASMTIMCKQCFASRFGAEIAVFCPAQVKVALQRIGLQRI